MFAKDKVSKALVDAVTSVLNAPILNDAFDAFKSNKDEKEIQKNAKKWKPDPPVTKPKLKSSETVKKEDKTSFFSFRNRLIENVYNARNNEILEILTEAAKLEESMSDDQKDRREHIVRSMKDDTAGFKSRYGSRAKDVMYATATKMAIKEDKDDDKKGDDGHNDEEQDKNLIKKSVKKDCLTKEDCDKDDDKDKKKSKKDDDDDSDKDKKKDPGSDDDDDRDDDFDDKNRNKKKLGFKAFAKEGVDEATKLRPSTQRKLDTAAKSLDSFKSQVPNSFAGLSIRKPTPTAPNSEKKN